MKSSQKTFFVIRTKTCYVFSTEVYFLKTTFLASSSNILTNGSQISSQNQLWKVETVVRVVFDHLIEFASLTGTRYNNEGAVTTYLNHHQTGTAVLVVAEEIVDERHFTASQSLRKSLC